MFHMPRMAQSEVVIVKTVQFGHGEKIMELNKAVCSFPR